jgi:hypothetical protein
MKKIVSVDPGKLGCGVAIWSEFGSYGIQVLWAGYVKNPEANELGIERVELWRAMGNAVRAVVYPFANPASLVLEIPQVYDGPRPEDPNDLIDLGGVQGAIACACNWPVEWSPVPREWKGQLPKEVSQKRVDKKLAPEEKERISWPIKTLRHNVYDALHLGIVYLEREGLREFAK